jgi:hypothetical protein
MKEREKEREREREKRGREAFYDSLELHVIVIVV